MTCCAPLLERMETSWTLVGHAHGAQDDATRARCLLLEHYSGAAWRYLLGATRNESLAEELLQEFALRILRGDMQRATKDRGRFRDYVRTVLINLVNDAHRDRSARPARLPEQAVADRGAGIGQADRDDDDLAGCLRAELLAQAWKILADDHPTYFLVMEAQVDDAESPTCAKAERVARRLGAPFSENRFRVVLHRARSKFAELLRREVAGTLPGASDQQIDDELRQLRLWRYCAPRARGRG